MDAAIGPLLPMFSCSNYKLPFRALTETEVTILSGLHDHWKKTSVEDADKLPEDLVRSMCGNCFHPSLVHGALGSNEVLRQWILSTRNEGGTLVADRNLAFSTFSELVGKVQAQLNTNSVGGQVKGNIQIDKTMPAYEDIVPISDKHVLPTIQPSVLMGYQKVQNTKKERFLQHCANAATQLLSSNVSKALKTAGQEAAFDSLRAPRQVTFDFESFASAIFGEDINTDPGTRNNTQMPSLNKVRRMKQAFEELGQCPTWCSIMAALLSVVECKEGTFWPVGFICCVGGSDNTRVLFVGDSHPRLNFLVVCNPGTTP